MTQQIARQDARNEIDAGAGVSTQTASSIIQVIERAATNPEVDIDKMERLLDMQERILSRQAEADFNRSMAAMQSEIPSITERGTIEVKGTERSKYATLEDIVDVVRPILQKHGFAISFRVDEAEHSIKVTGVVMHEGGHREETTMRLPYDQSGSKNAVQAMGSSVSYGKRYVLCAMLNITTRGEDDDGESAAPHRRVTPAQAAHLKALLDHADDAIRQSFAADYGDPEQVPERDYLVVKDHLANAIYNSWAWKAKKAESEEALTQVWKSGIEQFHSLGDVEAYNSFRELVTQRGKELKGKGGEG